MEELLCSLHNYTKFSGLPYSFYETAQAALSCGLDAMITSDKNIYAEGHDQYYYRSGEKLLFLCGEELFDPLSDGPHYISIGIEKEQFNRRPGNLSEEIGIVSGNDIGNTNYRHLELINAEDMLLQGLAEGTKQIRNNIRLFSDLLNTEKHYIGLAGTCSSVFSGKFSYEELMSTACNHIYSEEKLTGDFQYDKNILLGSLRKGRLFFALDGFADAKGFRFYAEGNNQDAVAWPGDTIYLRSSITLKILIPEACTCKLIHNGRVIKEWKHCRQVPYTIYEPGHYRVECSMMIRREWYDWIFSNPIYVVKG